MNHRMLIVWLLRSCYRPGFRTTIVLISTLSSTRYAIHQHDTQSICYRTMKLIRSLDRKAPFSLTVLVQHSSHHVWSFHPLGRAPTEAAFHYRCDRFPCPVYQISAKTCLITQLNEYIWVYPTFSSSNDPVPGTADPHCSRSALLWDNICPPGHLNAEKMEHNTGGGIE